MTSCGSRRSVRKFSNSALRGQEQRAACGRRIRRVRMPQPQATLRRPYPAHGAVRLPIGPIVRACRPRQWVKNAVVALGPAAGRELTEPGVAGRLLAVGIAFCLLSSATYLVNDVRDREQDRLPSTQATATGRVRGCSCQRSRFGAGSGTGRGRPRPKCSPSAARLPSTGGGLLSAADVELLAAGGGGSSSPICWRCRSAFSACGRSPAGAQAAGQSLPGALFAVGTSALRADSWSRESGHAELFEAVRGARPALHWGATRGHVTLAADRRGSTGLRRLLPWAFSESWLGIRLRSCPIVAVHAVARAVLRMLERRRGEAPASS